MARGNRLGNVGNLSGMDIMMQGLDPQLQPDTCWDPNVALLPPAWFADLTLPGFQRTLPQVGAHTASSSSTPVFQA